jgi:hypothetical protein
LDREYRVVYMTDELRRSNGGLIEILPELVIDRGGGMLRRFQSAGQTMDGEKVSDRLLFSW